MFTLTLLLLDRGRNIGKVNEIRDVTTEPGLCRERGRWLAEQHTGLAATTRGGLTANYTQNTALLGSALLLLQTSPSEVQAQGSTHRGRHHCISAEQV